MPFGYYLRHSAARALELYDGAQMIRHTMLPLSWSLHTFRGVPRRNALGDSRLEAARP